MDARKIRNILESCVNTKQGSFMNVASVMTLRWMDTFKDQASLESAIDSDEILFEFIQSLRDCGGHDETLPPQICNTLPPQPCNGYEMAKWMESVETSLPPPPSAPLYIFCDGSCLKNGASGASAGYGIYITKNDIECHRHYSRVPFEQPQTNQRAELLALQYALHYIASSLPSPHIAHIYTDSKYAMQCLTVWGPVWKVSGWRKYDKKPIQHLDIIQPCVNLYESMKDRVFMHHVLAHTNNKDTLSKGNEIADALAKQGAEM